MGNKKSMGCGTFFLNLLTIVFVILKLCGVIAWSWWLVLLPTIIWAVITIIVVIIAIKFFGWLVD